MEQICLVGSCNLTLDIKFEEIQHCRIEIGSYLSQILPQMLMLIWSKIWRKVCHVDCGHTNEQYV